MILLLFFCQFFYSIFTNILLVIEYLFYFWNFFSEKQNGERDVCIVFRWLIIINLLERLFGKIVAHVSKNKNRVAATLIEGLCDAKTRDQGYTKIHLSLKNIVIKLIIKDKIYTKNGISSTFY